MSGTQVAGLVSCSRIFQLRNSLPVASLAPFSPSSCRIPPLPSSASAFVSAATGCCCIASGTERVASASRGRAGRMAVDAGARNAPAHPQDAASAASNQAQLPIFRRSGEM
ncbi:hypothetical protein Ctob_005377 [Chrysochromulina tobinii]|uniref:Uncharacterized protein n=1 Tax=Chrysochromulina tobinii TaxID=1460289 RepID=A0A0M0J7N7_9EUKA|nr:hypothetical protein Ctob_005377 [Chrysochromulina tobinii]|eukprot:KOO22460.1 hypothetical protein Ctob_005377 [Chrysochromulina sp. CCMP291]